MAIVSRLILLGADLANVEPWPTIWKVCLVVTLAAFAIMAVLVTIGGAKDIFSLVKGLQQDQEAEDKRKASKR